MYRYPGLYVDCLRMNHAVFVQVQVGLVYLCRPQDPVDEVGSLVVNKITYIFGMDYLLDHEFLRT